MRHSSNQKVLVVEPDAAIRTLVVALLRREGYEVDAAGSVETALDCRPGGEHTVLVVDPRMPGGDTLLDLLQGDDPLPEPNVIILTTERVVRPEYTTDPRVRTVLMKPFFIEELAAAVASCCAVAN